MFRAEILWLANGPTLKMEGRLVGEWAEQARYLVTTDVVPKGLIVDLTEVSCVDSACERLLSRLGSVGAVFVASGVYAPAVCERLGLSPVRRMPVRRHGNNERSFQLRIPMQVDAGPGRHQKEEK
ncbi:MAG TPA: hypothetical protein VFF64_07780 [Candidatus Eremiobacteraceae bacterium]|nr:hypothetical protein [Candidatus Eremiobacteraceae bacterium]